MSKWLGEVGRCQNCGDELKVFPNFIDGRTKFGPWALLCPPCHAEIGVGIGLGKGQRYDFSTLEKVEG